MSRSDKRVHRERVVGTAKDQSVRLYAFANTRPAYQVRFSPEKPIIVLKTKRSADGQPQHPCAQWEPLSDVIFGANPNTTHAVFVADTTALSCRPGYEQAESVNGAAVGGTLKQLSNAVARLNPHDAVMVAAGLSAHLALKYVLVGEKTLGHRDRLVDKLVLVCPASLDELVRLTDAATRMSASRDPHYPKPTLVVLVKGGKDAVAAYERWLAGCAELFARTQVDADVTPTLFAAVARHAAGAGSSGDVVDTNSHYEHPRVYRIDFVLSKASKNVEQFPVLSPLDTLGVDDEYEESEEAAEEDVSDDDDGDDEEEGHADGHGHAHDHAHGCGCGDAHHNHADPEANHGGDDDGDEEEEEEGSSMYAAGLASLQQLREPVRVMLEGRVLSLEDGLVGTTEGCVLVEGLRDLVRTDDTLSRLLSSGAAGKDGSVCVALATRILRDDHGRTSLKALEARAMTKKEVKRSLTAGASTAEIPLHYNVSRIAHSYGAVLVRGRKCALVRDLRTASPSSTTGPAMRLPHQPLVERGEAAVECAVRALCEACEVSSDNMYCPSYLSPVVYYTKDTDEQGQLMLRCVTLYIALAVSPPPRGAASDAREDRLDPTEPYDWVSYTKALSLLASAEERAALGEVVQALQKATAAGLYRTFAGCGVFGDGVAGGGGGAGAPEVTAAPPPPPAAAALAGKVEVVALLCPGSPTLPGDLVAGARAALGVSDMLNFDGERMDTQTLVSAAEAALRRGEATLAVFVDPETTPVDDFCDEHLVALLEEHGVLSRLITVLTPQVCAVVADLAGPLAPRTAMVEGLLAGARVSDLLCVTVDAGAPPPAAALVSGDEETALWALLACCAEVNPDLTITRGWQGSQSRIHTEDIVAAMATAAARRPTASASLQHVCVELAEADTPVAPAALNFLTQPGSLDVFYASGDSFLMAADGVAWVATRPATQGLLALDLASHCLEVDGGDNWKALKVKPHSTLKFNFLCRSAAAAAQVRATAARLFDELKWSPARDGDDVKALKDPLPSWDE